jgi:hypothetical protein
MSKFELWLGVAAPDLSVGSGRAEDSQTMLRLYSSAATVTVAYVAGSARSAARDRVKARDGDTHGYETVLESAVRIWCHDQKYGTNDQCRVSSHLLGRVPKGYLAAT